MTNVAAKPVNGVTESARPEQSSWLTPRVNIHEEKDGYLLHAEMPGVTKEGIEILMEADELTIIGHRKAGELPGSVIHRESTDRDYRRVFALDPGINAGRIVARIDQGLLTLELPKAEKVKPRKIQVS